MMMMMMIDDDHCYVSALEALKCSGKKDLHFSLSNRFRGSHSNVSPHILRLLVWYVGTPAGALIINTVVVNKSLPWSQWDQPLEVSPSTSHLVNVYHPVLVL